MTRQEAAGLVGIMIRAYPNSDKYTTKEAVNETVNLWATLFSDDDSAIVGLAVKKHIMTSKWPPSVAEIREIMADITHPDLIPPDQAWAAVADLLYAESEYSSSPHRRLPPLIAQTVDAIGGWSTLYNLHCGHHRGNKDGMDRVAFMDLYRPAYERARADACCSTSLLGSITTIRQQLTTGGIAQLEAAKQRRKEQEDFYKELTMRAFRTALEQPDEVPALPETIEEDT